MAPGGIALITSRLREYLLLERVHERVARRSLEQQRRVREYHDAGTVRLQAADELRGPLQVPASFLLYQQATVMFARALVAEQGDVQPESLSLPVDAVAELEERIAAGTLDPLPELSAVAPALISADPLAADRLASADAAMQADALSVAVQVLRERIEPRSPEQVRTTRRWRVATAIIAISAVAGVIAKAMLTTPNVALHKICSSSSVAHGTAAAGAVDGERASRFDFHSAEEDAPWLAIDLGRPTAIKTVKVYGRSDCCFEQSVPLILEVGDDALAYREIAKKTDAFAGDEPWVTHATTTARFVRLRVNRRSVLVLSEVEVLGRAH